MAEECRHHLDAMRDLTVLELRWAGPRAGHALRGPRPLSTTAAGQAS